MDVDIVFLKNPLSHVTKFDNHVPGHDHMFMGNHHVTTDAPWDIIAQWDGYGYNTGFLFVNSTIQRQKFYASIRKVLVKYHELTDQQAFNRALDVSGVPIKVKCLAPGLFMHGLTFFTAGRRQFADDRPCLNCILVHNNYVVGMAYKRY